MTNRVHWIRFIVGGRGDDNLKGTAGRDVILGRDGADVLDGGAGNDILIGDGVYWSWNHCYWGKPRGSQDDTLDGGAGSDLLFAGRGDDLANYTLPENIGAHDVYDGGTGFDTLQLTLTHAELQLASVQDDIAAFKAYLECKANPWSDDGRTFEFKSFNLDVRDFEALEIQLIGGNTAPVAQNDNYALDEDTVLLIPGPGVAGNDMDLDGSALSVALVAGPAHGALALNANGSFSYMPEANFNGTDSFTYVANDGSTDSNEATVSLTINSGNDAPDALGDTNSTDEATPVEGNVLANDTDADTGDVLTVNAVNGEQSNVGIALLLASGALLTLDADGSYRYDPNGAFETLGAGASADDGVAYMVTDGHGGFDAAAVAIAVAGVNDGPVASADSASTDQDHGVTIDVLANDSDVDAGDTLSIVAASVTSGVGSATIVGDQVEYAPGADYQYLGAGDSAEVSIAYTVADRLGAESSSVASLTVTGVNDVPTAVDDPIATDEDTQIVVSVLANDTDVDGDSLFPVLVLGPAHGTLGLNGDGSITYTPYANFNGTDSFTYVANDGSTDSNEATVSLTINSVNDAPVANDDVTAEHAISLGKIRVAVIGGSTSSYLAAADQLDNQNTSLSISADAISARAVTTEDQWTALLNNYDTVVLGDNGNGLDYNAATPLFRALGAFVDTGGGVVTTGWFAFMLPRLPAEADYITPLAPQPYQFARSGSTITVIDTAHPITDGVASYRVNALAHELAGGIDAGATVLARGVTANGTSLPALVVDEVGERGGLTAYFGSLQMASASTYSPDRIPGGTVDQIFERIVAWAAGPRNVLAATDEDTPLAIDPATLLANDRDIENDALAIGAVSETSTLGGAVSIDAAGSIVYDPTKALQLQSLQPGEIVTDSFNYSVLDGHGGVDIGTVSLTVAGRADADSLL